MSDKEEPIGNPWGEDDERFLELMDSRPKEAMAAAIQHAMRFFNGDFVDDPGDPRLKNPRKFGGTTEVLKQRYEQRFGKGRKPEFSGLIRTNFDE
jgi:hypothetical protein